MTDIAAQRFDAGVRSGSRVDKDMVAVRIAPDLCMAAVAAPAYFQDRTPPASPRELTEHRCINLRLPTYGGLYAWEFERDGEAVQVRVQGQATFNNTLLMLRAALDGLGICYVPQDMVQEHLAAGRLVPVLQPWWPTFPGYHLYYAHRRQMSPALAKVVQALRLSSE